MYYHSFAIRKNLTFGQMTILFSWLRWWNLIRSIQKLLDQPSMSTFLSIIYPLLSIISAHFKEKQSRKC